MLKKYFGIMLFMAFLLCAFEQVSAQANEFEEENLSALTTAAWKKLEGATYRLTITTTTFKYGSKTPNEIYTTIRETIPPEREHSISESKTLQGVKRSEYIRVGARKFIRIGNGEWKELTEGIGEGIGAGSGNGRRAIVLPKIETTIERKLKKGVLLGKSKTDYYEKTTTNKYIYPTETYSIVTKQTYWFDTNGRIVKNEYIYDNGAAKSITRTVNEYDFDAKLKIEVPILSKETK